MSATSSAAGSGAVLGIVLVLLLQQFGYLALTGLLWSVVAVVVGAVVGGLAFGLAARAARRPTKPSS